MVRIIAISKRYTSGSKIKCRTHLCHRSLYFSYNEHLAAKKNFLDRLEPLRRMLNIWSSRDKVIIKCYFSLVLQNLEIRNYFKQFNVNLPQEWRFPINDKHIAFVEKWSSFIN